MEHPVVDTPPADAPTAAPDGPLAEVAARHASGAADADPVRWQHITALARRAETQQGLARQLLLQRLQSLLQAYPATPRATPSAPAPAMPGPLAELVALLADATPLPLPPATSEGAPRAAAPASPAEPPTLKSVHLFRDTWTRLATDRRLAQAEAALPDNAGPLNSQLLVHRALRQMRETSPAYLRHFMGYVEALLWMEQAQAAAPARSGPVGTKPTPTKGPRGRKNR